jgi:hypothetical protein
MTDSSTVTTHLSKISKSSSYDTSCDSKYKCEDDTPKTLIETLPGSDLHPKSNSKKTSKSVVGKYRTVGGSLRGEITIKKDHTASIFLFDIIRTKYNEILVKNEMGMKASLKLGKKGKLIISDINGENILIYLIESITYSDNFKQYIKIRKRADSK